MASAYGVGGSIPYHYKPADGEDLIQPADGQDLEDTIQALEGVLANLSTAQAATFAERFFALFQGQGQANGEHDIDGALERGVLGSGRRQLLSFGTAVVQAPAAGAWSADAQIFMPSGYFQLLSTAKSEETVTLTTEEDSASEVDVVLRSKPSPALWIKVAVRAINPVFSVATNVTVHWRVEQELL